MNSKLPIDEALLTKYILNELDPSEELLVENAMLADENTLIEVESLRSTYKKIKHLPLISAPSAVLNKVSESASNRRMAPKMIRLSTGYQWAAAAAVILTATLGFVIMEPGFVAETPPQTPEVHAADIPWTDNRNILHINDQEGLKAVQANDSLNTGKLVPLSTTPSGETSRFRDVQLTGTNK